MQFIILHLKQILINVLAKDNKDKKRPKKKSFMPHNSLHVQVIKRFQDDKICEVLQNFCKIWVHYVLQGSPPLLVNKSLNTPS